MFEYIRNHQRLMQFFLLLIIAPLFVIGGLQAFRFGENDTAIAKVGGKPITQMELDNALRTLDPQTRAQPGIRKEMLGRLIAERAMSIEAAHDHIYPTAAEKWDIVQKSFPSLGDPKLSKDEKIKLYNEIANGQGLTVEGLEAKATDYLISERIAGEIKSSGFASKSVAGRISDLIEQEREVQQIAYKAADFTSQVKINDEMLKAYYKNNLAQFQVPEQARIEYVVLSIANLSQQMPATDEEAKTYYDNNRKRYVTEEQRRASHILIKVAKNAGDAARAQAKAKAEKLLAEVRKTPGEFAKLAKENSEDEGSAAHGGDLDFFGKGMMVKPFQDAVDKLKPGEISDLVLSDFGYHIIMLTAIKPADVKSYDDVRDGILAELKKQKAAKKFSELRETFTNTVYEQADSLKPVIDKLGDSAKLKIESAAGVTRKPDPSVAPTIPYNNQKFLTALFADDSIKNKHNTEAILVSDGTLISGRIAEYKAATQKPFADVQPIVREAVTQEEAHNLAQKAGEAKLAALKAKDDPSGFGEAQIISRNKQTGVNPILLQTLMKADTGKLPAFVGSDLPSQGYVVSRINKVSQPATTNPGGRETMRQQIGNALAEGETSAYVEVLKQKANVKILQPDAVKKDAADIDGN